MDCSLQTVATKQLHVIGLDFCPQQRSSCGLGLRRKIQAHKSSKQWVAKAISPGGRKPTLVGDGHKPLAVSPAVRALLGSKSLRL